MILLGLGSNLSSNFGDRFKNIDLAVLALNEYGVRVKKKSSYYESLSYPNKENPKFIKIFVTDTNRHNIIIITIFWIFINIHKFMKTC